MLLKRLLQDIRVPVIPLQTFGAIAGQKDERPAMAAQGVCYGIAAATMEIKIENGEIGLFCFQRFERPVDRRRDLDAFAANVEKRVLDQHGDDGFVLDDENVEILDLFHRALSLASKGKLDHKHPIGDFGSKSDCQNLD
jgi:hypothetical protein